MVTEGVAQLPTGGGKPGVPVSSVARAAVGGRDAWCLHLALGPPRNVRTHPSGSRGLPTCEFTVAGWKEVREHHEPTQFDLQESPGGLTEDRMWGGWCGGSWCARRPVSAGAGFPSFIVGSQSPPSTYCSAAAVARKIQR